METLGRSRMKRFMLSFGYIIPLMIGMFGGYVLAWAIITPTVEEQQSVVLFELVEAEPEIEYVVPTVYVENPEKLYYITDRVNVREQPSIQSESINIMNYGDRFYGVAYDGWTYFNQLGGYIKSDYLSETIEEETLTITSRGFKSFMDYTSISRDTSQGWLQSIASTEEGFRMIDGRYCIAVGTGLNATLGQYIDLVLDNGEVIHAIVAEMKSDKDTNEDNITTTHNGCVSEFLVDTSELSSEVRKAGDVSKARNGWNSPVTEIRVYNKTVF